MVKIIVSYGKKVGLYFLTGPFIFQLVLGSPKFHFLVIFSSAVQDIPKTSVSFEHFANTKPFRLNSKMQNAAGDNVDLYIPRKW